MTDPFSGGDKTPAISFKDQPIGTVRTIIATEYATMAQSRDYETGDPAFWPDGNKKMSAVLKGTDLDGEPVSLWAAHPSAMLAAVGKAQEAIGKGYRVKPGDRVDIKHYADKPNEKNPRLNAQKLYQAKITPDFRPVAQQQPADDPWASQPAAPTASTDGFGDEPPF